MGKSLIIVESPGKIKTLSKFLGKNFIVEASKGHVIDLPPSRFGVNIKNGFIPTFIATPDRKDVILKLQKLAKTVDKIYLAPDPDREGEAISWHLANVLDIDPKSDCRITFNSITKTNVLKSLESPRPIKLSLVNAQQSRRILDRLMGYKLSPLLWQKVCMGLSAGRVQSVAVLLICEREKEILAFIPEEYWTITARVKTQSNESFLVKLMKIKGKKAVVPNGELATKIVDEVKSSSLSISNIISRNKKQSPPPPFITSTLQSEAAQKFSFTPRRTMSIAQKLYEGIALGDEGQVGLITYMRTDSTRISPEGISELRDYLSNSFSKEYQLDKVRTFKMKKGAQDAHEAIRATSVLRTPDKIAKYLKPEQLKLYRLIWNRYVASQMAEAQFNVVTITIDVGDNQFQASGTTMTFDGYTCLYSTAKKASAPSESFSSQDLPHLSKSEKIDLQSINPEQNFTNPPARYTESSLIKTLEKEGIGRPSTYASIVETIQQRKYVKKIEAKFHPTDVAFVVTWILKKCFNDVVTPGFTSKMESALDAVEAGSKDWKSLLNNFYEPFSKDLERAENEIEKVRIPSDCVCKECGKVMMVRLARTGKFMACSGYPECKNTINIPDEISLFANGIPKPPNKMKELLEKIEVELAPGLELLDEVCEKCGAKMAIRNGRFGRFISCTNYPECKNTRQIVKDTGIICPKENCNGKILEKKSKRGRLFYGCSKYPECDFTAWALPTGELCPECGGALVWHSTKKLGKYIKCSTKGCKYTKFPEGEDDGDQKET